MQITLFDQLFGLSDKTKSIFFRQLASMIDSGVTYVAALSSMRTNFPGQVGRLIDDILPGLRQGKTLSEMLAQFPHYFTPFFINILRAGEQGGTVDIRLKELADHMERSHKAKMEMLAKLAYPILLLHCVVIIPTVPMVVLKGPEAYARQVLSELAGLYALAAAIFFIRRAGDIVKPARLLLDQVTAVVPPLSKLVRLKCSMEFLRALGELYEAGISAGLALKLAAESCGNSYIEKKLVAGIPRLDRGENLMQVLTETRLLPQTALQMLSSGEVTGTIGTSLKKAADMLEVDVKGAMAVIMTVVPTLVGLVVALMAAQSIISQVQQIYAPLNQMMP